jgi:hypothetical protein
MKDMKNEMASIRQQNNRMDGLRMRVDRRGNIIGRAIRNVKTNFVDFMNENADVDDDDHNFVSASIYKTICR